MAGFVVSSMSEDHALLKNGSRLLGSFKAGSLQYGKWSGAVQRDQGGNNNVAQFVFKF